MTVARPPAADAVELTAVVIALDEARRLGPCLASLAFCDELLVVDGGSRDETRAIATAHGARVIDEPFRDWAASRERGRAEARGAWILSIDADERVSPALAREVRAAIASADEDAGAFDVAVRTYYRDRWLRHGGFWPARRTRLYRRDRAHYDPARPVHERVVAAGRTSSLREPLDHHAFTSFADGIARVERYSRFGAQALHERGRGAGPARMIAHGLGRFLRGYVLRGGFLDGVPGLWFAALGGFEAFSKYARLWELGRAGRDGARRRALPGPTEAA